MLQIETIDNLQGFGDRNVLGECFYLQNMMQGQFGLEANIEIVEESTTDSPGRFNWFARKAGTQNPGLYAVDTTGKIFLRDAGTWELSHDGPNGGNSSTPTASSGNGLIGDGGPYLLYAQDGYLGRYSGVTWSNQYKDFNNTDTNFKPMEIYEDWVVIGNESEIAIHSLTDSSWNEQALELPSGFVVRAIKANQTGVLIGANHNGRGVIFLWDVRSVRSISEWIWFESPIQSICKYGPRWIVTTEREQVITDGYSTAPLPLPPDAALGSPIFNVIPAGTLVINNKLYTANTSSQYSRLKSGLYVQDLTTGLFQFVSAANGCTAGVTMGALYQDTDYSLYVSYSTSLPNANFVAKVVESSPTSATLISPRLGAGPNQKIAEGVKLDISVNSKNTPLNTSGGLTVGLKVYNFKRQLWGYGVTNNASASADTLKVDGTASGYNNAKVGDEVTILSGANAGQVRHIITIANAGTNTETWTLDSALSGNTESGAYFNVQPFQLIKSKTLSFSDLSEIESVYFDIRNRIKGRKFLVKAVITGISGASVTIPSLSFVYDELGIV